MCECPCVLCAHKRVCVARVCAYVHARTRTDMIAFELSEEFFLCLKGLLLFENAYHVHIFAGLFAVFDVWQIPMWSLWYF